MFSPQNPAYDVIKISARLSYNLGEVKEDTSPHLEKYCVWQSYPATNNVG